MADDDDGAIESAGGGGDGAGASGERRQPSKLDRMMEAAQAKEMKKGVANFDKRAAEDLVLGLDLGSLAEDAKTGAAEGDADNADGADGADGGGNTGLRKSRADLLSDIAHGKSKLKPAAVRAMPPNPGSTSALPVNEGMLQKFATRRSHVVGSDESSSSSGSDTDSTKWD